MKENEEKYDIILGIFDVITKKIRESIAESKEKNKKPLGVGVYSTQFCNDKLLTDPMKSDEHRMQIALGLDGVDFVFKVDSKAQSKIQDAAEKAYQEYLNELQEEENEKKYTAGFIIGSFDLLHAGHIENINLAHEMCRDLYIVLKTDERIKLNKHKDPIQNTTKRASNIKALKDVQGVLYMDVDSTREDVLNDFIKKYLKDHPDSTLDKSEIVAIFGEDLKEKEMGREEWKDINVEFTSRPPEKMKVVSSTAYQKKLKENGGIEEYEQVADKFFTKYLEEGEKTK